MKSTFKKTKGSKIALEVVLEAGDFKPHYDHVLSEALKQINLKGFRPGAAPREIAMGAIDQEKVFEEAVNDAARHTLAGITESHEWVVIDRPMIEVVESSDVLKTGGLQFKVELTVFPEVDLADYKKIAKKINADKKEGIVSDAEIEKAFKWVLKSRAPMIRVNRVAQNGDILEINIQTMHENKAVPGGNIEKDKFELGEGKFIPGFEEKVVGHKEGETIEFSLIAPKNYWQKEFQNKKLDFKVKINSVFEAKLPEVNDNFAKTLGAFKTIEDVKKNIAEGLKIEMAEREAEKRKIKMLDEIIKESKMDLPEIFITKTLDGLMEELKLQIEAAKENLDEARKNLMPAAEKRVAGNVVVHEIAKAEKLEPTKEEVEAESKYHTSEARGLDADRYYDYIYGIILNRKVFEFLAKE